MEQLLLAHPDFQLAPLGDDVVALPNISIGKVQATPGTPSLLLPEEVGHLPGQLRMATQARCPVDPVAVKGALVSSDFHMAGDRFVCMVVQPCSSCRVKVPSSARGVAPVMLGHPACGFLGMAASGPGPEFAEELPLHAVKDPRGDAGGVIVDPPANDAVELEDEDGLFGRSSSAYHAAECLLVSLLRLFAGCDEGLKAKRVPVGVPPGVVFADGMLAHMPTQEVKPHMALVGGDKGMGDAGLTWLQFQTQSAQPGGDALLRFLDHASLLVQQDEVISVADDQGLPLLYLDPIAPDAFRKRCADVSL